MNLLDHRTGAILIGFAALGIAAWLLHGLVRYTLRRTEGHGEAGLDRSGTPFFTVMTRVFIGILVFLALLAAARFFAAAPRTPEPWMDRTAR